MFSQKIYIVVEFLCWTEHYVGFV